MACTPLVDTSFVGGIADMVSILGMEIFPRTDGALSVVDFVAMV